MYISIAHKAYMVCWHDEVCACVCIILYSKLKKKKVTWLALYHILGK
jgi:hypothetical protein